MHEWMHTAGFYHLDQDNDDFDAAAYDTGEIVESIGGAFSRDATKKLVSRLPFYKNTIGPAFTLSNIIYETGRSLSEPEETTA